jgi:hypothetical protein
LMANCLRAGRWARLSREQELRDSFAREAILGFVGDGV